MIKPLKKMIHLIFLYLCVCCLVGVFSVDEVKLVSVLEGESVTLNPDLTEKWKNEEIEWKFGHKDILIAHINRQNNKDTFYDDSPDGRFRGRLKLDQTGSLTITNTRTTDSGLYKVFNTKTKTLLRTFNLMVCGVFSVDEVKPESVLEGESVTLNPDLTEKWKNEELEWKFGHNSILIAHINRQNNKDTVYDGSADGRFRGRLKLDQTGSLTITNTRTTDSGLYKVFNTKTDTLLRTFNLMVCVFGADGDEVKRVSVMKGDSVTLDTDLTVTKGINRIQWWFGDSFIATVDKNKISYTDDERFRDRLKLNDQTGSLTINNMRITDSGLYKVQISHNTGVSNKTFSVTVNGPSSGDKAGTVVGVLLLVLSAAAAAVLLSTQNL